MEDKASGLPANSLANSMIVILIIISIIVGISGCYIGLMLSFYFDMPSGPAIIVSVGAMCILSMLFGSNGGFLRRLLPLRHLKN